MRELGLLAKVGADGVLVMAAPDGTAVAVKALDGGTRAGDLVALALLARFAPDHVDRATLPGVLAAVLVDQLIGDDHDDDVALLVYRHPAEVASSVR